MSTVIACLLGVFRARQYFCHHCQRTVTIIPSPGLSFPICHNDLLEEHIPPTLPRTHMHAAGLSSYGIRPSSRTVVEGLLDFKITGDLLACAVCQDSFEISKIVKQIPCNQIYHKDCILPWLELHNSCPVYRFELPTDDHDYENQRNGRQNDNSHSSNGDHVGSHRQMVRNVARRVTMALQYWCCLMPRSSLGRRGSGGNRDGGRSNDSGQSNAGVGGGHVGEDDQLFIFRCSGM